MATTDTKICPYCDKRGIAIIPIRHAIAVPGLNAPKNEEPPIKLTGNHISYTKRVLRAGYLYVFDEINNELSEYQVSENGYYYKTVGPESVVKIKVSPPPAPLKPFSCPDLGHRVTASSVMVPHNAETVWLCFSGTKWTPRIAFQANDPKWRQKAMRMVKMSKGPKQAHCMELTVLKNNVCEYALKPDQKAALVFSLAPFESRVDQIVSLNMLAGSMNGKALAVMLDDPIGIVMDLSQMVKRRLHHHLNRQDIVTPLTAYSTIGKIKEGIEQNAEEQYIKSKTVIHSSTGGRFPVAYDSGKRHDVIVSEKELKDARNAEWEKYAKKYNVGEAEAWQKSFALGLEDLNAKVISPAASAHAEWLKSAETALAFEAHHDDQDVESGISYAATFTLCISGSTDKVANAVLYEDWISSSDIKRDNLALRALALNQEKLVSEIQKSLELSIDWRGFPNDAIATAFAETVKNSLSEKNTVIGKLLVELLGPLTEHLVTQTAGGKIKPAMVMMGLYADRPIVKLNVSGTQEEFVRTAAQTIQKTLQKNTGQTVSTSALNNAIRRNIGELKARGIDMSRRVSKDIWAIIDPDVLKDIPKNMTKAQQADWAIKAIRTVPDMEKIHMDEWGSKFKSEMSSSTVSKLPLAAAAVALVFQGYGIQKMSEDLAKANAKDTPEALTRLSAGYAAIVGTSLDAAEKISAKLAARGLIRSEWIKTWMKRAGEFGKFIGVAAAVVVALWDVYLANSAFQKKQYGMMTLYIASAFFGVGAAYLLTFTAFLTLGLVFLLIFILVAVLIEIFKDNKLKIWLERCYWGKDTSARFKTAQEHIDEFNAATS